VKGNAKEESKLTVSLCHPNTGGKYLLLPQFPVAPFGREGQFPLHVFSLHCSITSYIAVLTYNRDIDTCPTRLVSTGCMMAVLKLGQLFMNSEQ